jgi:Carboxypeptidase regulatory-like domain
MKLRFFKTRFTISFILLFINHLISAQTPTQTVRGYVVDAANGKALIGAGVQLIGTNFSTAADTEGVFIFNNVPVGRYSLKASFIGFEPAIISDFWVQTGKEVILQITLKSTSLDIDTLNITATNPRFNNKTSDPVILLTDPFTRYAATFNDPARAITYLAGAATDNDQGNNISVRGNTPNALQWYLEGAEIVNPNHLSNAGTPSDRTTANGGGVLIVGANMMESATFHKGAMATDLGGSLTSIMDLKLRKGNDKKRQTFASIGLIGVEAGTEGMFSKNSAASYLVHYRYSTVGLLSKMGVPLGDETITFQDVTYNFNFPTKKAGSFNIFGMHGWSDNVFKNKPRLEWVTEKDSQDITFKNQMNVVGLKHNIGLGNKVFWQTVAAYSWLNNSRNAIGYNANRLPIIVEEFENNQSKLFIKSKLDWQLSRGDLHIGMAFKDENIDNFYIYKEGNTNIKSNPKGQDYWLQPFVEWTGNAGKNVQYRLGMRGSVLTKAEDFSVEPSLGVQYNFENYSAISLNLSAQSQVLSPYIYSFTKDETTSAIFPINAFHLTKSNNANLNYRFNIKNVAIDLGGFYQTVFDAPQLVFGNSITVLDELDNAQTAIWDRDDFAKGRNAGVEIDINRGLSKGYHWRVNATFYDSKILDANGKERNARFNGQYIFNALTGKEWVFGKNKNKFWGINGHVILRGGFRETPINLTASKTFNETVYDNLNPFSLKLKDYFRTDLSLYFKRNRLKWSSTLQLDIQNVTNYQNEAWHYFDRFKKEVKTKYQLGSIPNLSYRVEF